jgi:hypothetical protein
MTGQGFYPCSNAEMNKARVVTQVDTDAGTSVARLCCVHLLTTTA